MSSAISIPALIGYAIEFGYEGAELNKFVTQWYQELLDEEEELRRLEEEQLNCDEEIELEMGKWAIEVSYYDYQKSEWDIEDAISKQEDEILQGGSLSIDQRIHLLTSRRERRAQVKARLQIAECAMREQLKNFTLVDSKSRPAILSNTPNLPQAEDIKNLVDALSRESDTVKITTPVKMDSPLINTPDAPVGLDCATTQEPRTLRQATDHQLVTRDQRYADKRRIPLSPDLPVAAKPRADKQEIKLELSPLTTKSGSRPLRSESNLSPVTNDTSYCVPGQNKNFKVQTGQRKRRHRRTKLTCISYRETSGLLVSWCAVCYHPPFCSDHPILRFDKSLSII